MASAYLVPVAQLLRDVPSTMDLDFRAPFDERHEFAPRGSAETDVSSDAEVLVQISLQSFAGGLHVKGKISAPWCGICRRCSLPVVGMAEVTVRERYVDYPGPGGEDAYPIVNDFIDLEPLVHELILLDLPLAPLCREECAGLCGVCGNDRNDQPCDCQTPVDPRWATLEGLRFADEADDAGE